MRTFEKSNKNVVQRKHDNETPESNITVGRNAVLELLKSGRDIDKLFVKKGASDGSITVIIAEAANRRIPIVYVEQQKLDALSCGVPHQGVCASAAEKAYSSIDEIIEIAKSRNEKPLIVIADGIEDPYNLGAVIRTAECAGAHGVIIPKRHSAGLTQSVTKASCGAIEHMAIAKVSNISLSIDELKEKGFWIFAAEAGGTPYYECDMNCPVALVFGSEGDGVSHLVKQKSDYIVSIPMYGRLNSLNVSCAAAVILNEAARQHRIIRKECNK